MRHRDGGRPPARTGASHATIAPYGPFQCGDGKTVFFGIQNNREWARFCDLVLGRPELATDPRFESNLQRVANRDTLHAIIDAQFAHTAAAEVIAHLDQAGIANARQNSVQEFWDHPQLEARNRWREIETEVGAVRAMLPPATFRNSEPQMGSVPALGANTDQILRALGYSEQDIQRLRSEGAI